MKLIYYIIRSIFLSLLFLGVFSCEKSEELLTIKEKQWLKDHPNLVAAINPTYPPYQFINEQGELDGIFIAIMESIEKKIDYKFNKISFNNWSDIIEATKKKKVDLIVEIQKTENRSKYLSFIKPIVSHPHVIVTSKTLAKGQSLKKLKDKKIGVIKEYAIEEYVHKSHLGIEYVSVVNDEDGYRMLLEGKITAFISFKAVANYFINQKGFQSLHINSELPYLNRLGIANRKELTVLTSILMKASKDISDKEKKSILDNWSYTLEKPVYKRAKFWIILVALILSLLLINFFINRYLTYRIKAKTKELEEAKEKAEENDRLKTAFIHNISHEIRTPINSIAGFINMMQKNIIPKEEYSKYFNIIKHSSDQLVNVIDDILEISKLDTKQSKVNLTIVNISELIQELGAIFEIKTLEKNISLELSIINDFYAVTDATKLRKIISNLIDNAVKFTKKGVINITLNKLENQFSIIVQDTGTGISQNEFSNIFKRFQKVNCTTKKEEDGLGLGLSIVKENVNLLDGTISVISKIGEGSSFTVKLPYVKAEVKKVETISIDSFKGDRKLKTILIAEDGKVNFMVLKMILLKIIKEPVIIYHALNGEEAVLLVKKHSEIDLVLMDIKMPVMDGYEATKLIKGIDSNMCIIAQSAYTTEEDKEKALTAGCDNLITKPIDMEKLKLVLAEYFLIH